MSDDFEDKKGFPESNFELVRDFYLSADNLKKFQTDYLLIHCNRERNENESLPIYLDLFTGFPARNRQHKRKNS